MNGPPRVWFGDSHAYVTTVPFADSLCHRCAHLRVVTSGKGSTFLMCREPSLPKYPPQPVRACVGFANKGSEG